MGVKSEIQVCLSLIGVEDLRVLPDDFLGAPHKSFA